MQKIWGIIFLGIIIASCQKEKDLTVREVRSDEIGKEAICPVLGNKFTITQETRAVDYKGETYYFCCPGCDSKFISEPEKYTKKSVEEKTLTKEERAKEGDILYWTCSMHPQVKQDKPGKCPICAMELIPIYKGEADKIIVEERTAEILGIRSYPVEKMELTKIIRLPGKVAYDNELYLTQQEYLSSFRNWQKVEGIDNEQKNRMKEALDAVKFKLLLFGYNEDAIGKLQQFTEPDKNLIYPDKKVWIHAEIYENNLHLVKVGQKAIVVVPAYPGEEFIGIVRFIELILDAQTRSSTARIEVENTENKLKLEMYANLEIKVNLGEHLAIPRSALINTGTREIVYLNLGNGRYKMQEVKTGVETGDYVQVMEGLEEGDLVVGEGNFLLDSQSTLTGGQALLYGAAEEIKKNPQEVEHK